MSLKTKNEIEIVGRERLTPALQLAKKFAATSLTRPVLTMANLTPDGNLQATDSHRLVKFKDVHSYKEDICINFQTLNIERGWDYPDTTNVLKNINEKPTNTAHFKRVFLKEIIATLKFYENKVVKQGTAFRNFVAITIEKNKITFDNKVFNSSITIEELFEVDNTVPIKFSIQPKYFIDVLETFLTYSDDDSIPMNFYNPMRALIFDNHELTMVLLPVRTY